MAPSCHIAVPREVGRRRIADAPHKAAAPGTLQTATETHSRAAIHDSAAYCLGGVVQFCRAHAFAARCSTRIEAEILELPAPIGVGIPQSLDIDTPGQSSFDCCFDELGCKKGQ